MPLISEEKGYPTSYNATTHITSADKWIQKNLRRLTEKPTQKTNFLQTILQSLNDRLNLLLQMQFANGSDERWKMVENGGIYEFLPKWLNGGT